MEGATFHVLHHEIVVSALFKKVADRCKISVGQPAEELSFPMELLFELSLLIEGFCDTEQFFDGNILSQSSVLGEIHIPHASTSDQTDNLIATL